MKLPKFSLRRFQKGGYQSEILARAEQLFLAPPFTEDYVKSIELISTRLSLKNDEASRLLWQQESNAASLSEYETLQPLFEVMPKPGKVLEVGPGFGRSVVFFERMGVWEPEAAIHLYDANGKETKYKQEFYDGPPIWPDVSSFCGNLNQLQSTLEYNKISNFRIFDAAATPLSALPGPYDLIYGFYSIGFHWSLQFYLDDLEKLMDDRSILIVTMNKHFKPFPSLSGYSVRVLESRTLKRSSKPMRLMALSRSPLPHVGVELSSLGY